MTREEYVELLRQHSPKLYFVSVRQDDGSWSLLEWTMSAHQHQALAVYHNRTKDTDFIVQLIEDRIEVIQFDLLPDFTTAWPKEKACTPSQDPSTS